MFNKSANLEEPWYLLLPMPEGKLKHPLHGVENQLSSPRCHLVT